MRLLLLVTSLLQLVVACGDDAPAAPYGTFCLGILGNIYQFQTKNCTIKDFRRSKCYCVDPRYIESVVDCVEQYLQNVTETKRSALRNSSYMTIMGTCNKVKMTDLYAVKNNITTLPVYYGKTSGKTPGQWPVYSAFRLSNKELSDALNQWIKAKDWGKNNRKSGAAVLAFWGGVLLMKGILHFGEIIFPLFFRRAGNTQIGRFYRRYFEIYCPQYSLMTVSQFIILVAFFAVLSCVSFLDLPYYFPTYIYRYRDMSTYGVFLGSRTGVLALYILPLFVLFAGRNNFLQWLTGWNHEPFLVFHRWVARSEVALILAHTIAYTLCLVGTKRYQQAWKRPYWNWGVVSFVFGMLIIVQAVRFLRRYAYETFLVIHIIAAIFYIVGAYYHIKFIGEFNDYKFFYATFAVWGFDRLARFIRIGIAGIHECTLVLEDKNMLVCTMNKPSWWSSSSSPGSYAFVHFMMPLTFWQSHPLTLTASASDPNKIKLYFRVYSGISKTLADRALQAGTEGIKMKILLDGPYGIAYDLEEYDECVFIAGGSGITAPLAYLQNSKATRCNTFQNTVLHWAVHDEAALCLFKDELEFLRNEMNCDVNVYVSKHDDNAKFDSNSETWSKEESLNENGPDAQPEKHIKVSESSISDLSPSKEYSYKVYSGRINVRSVVEKHITEATGPLSVMCCGPTGLHIDARNTISSNMNKTPHYVQYYEESYSW